MLEPIYNLKNDKHRIATIQEASLDKASEGGLKIENNLLFGSPEWFEAIEAGQIKKHIIKGKISKVYMSGHNDYPQFEIDSSEGKTNWTRNGNENAYKVGKDVELIYVEQKFKKPSFQQISNCVLQINIDTNN